MKLYTEGEVPEEPDHAFYDYENEESQFKPFHKTYKLITCAMITSAVYPHPELDKYRIPFIIFVLLSVTPFTIMIFIDMYKSWLEGDVVNIIRHSTVIGPFLGGLFKIILMHHKRERAAYILKEFNRDYNLYNKFRREYRTIAESGIHNSLLFTERVWVLIVVVCVMIFPTMAIVQNIYNFLFKSDAVKYMIHDLNKPFAEPDARFESPYFEYMFLYEIYFSFLYVIMFVGYDAFYGLSINHACMKIQLYCKALKNVLHSGQNVREMVVEVIKEQRRMYKFVDLIQETFNVWLGIIFIATMIQICTCLFHITEGYGFDLRYMIFVTGAVTHIYLPCRYAAKLKDLSMKSSWLIYCSGWELVNDKQVCGMIKFMIARAQRPAQIIALDMITFDMELFLSILQSSYSMYTLLRS